MHIVGFITKKGAVILKKFSNVRRRITHGVLTMLLRNTLHQSSEILFHVHLLNGFQKFSVHRFYYILSLTTVLDYHYIVTLSVQIDQNSHHVLRP